MIRIIIIGLAIVGFIAIARKMFGPGSARRDDKCADCIHCRKLYRDGVLCGFEAREVFKNPAHIDMCPDHESLRI